MAMSMPITGRTIGRTVVIALVMFVTAVVNAVDNAVIILSIAVGVFSISFLLAPS